MEKAIGYLAPGIRNSPIFTASFTLSRNPSHVGSIAPNSTQAA
jgi:hypothetical protein